jgi:hypothetical protein
MSYLQSPGKQCASCDAERQLESDGRCFECHAYDELIVRVGEARAILAEWVSTTGDMGSVVDRARIWLAEPR